MLNKNLLNYFNFLLQIKQFTVTNKSNLVLTNSFFISAKFCQTTDFHDN